jgi:hypothetical protein
MKPSLGHRRDIRLATASADADIRLDSAVGWRIV